MEVRVDPAVARRAAVSLSSALVALMRRDDARWGETGVELCASSFRDDDLDASATF